MRKFVVVTQKADRFDSSLSLDMVEAEDQDQLALKVAGDYIDFEEGEGSPWATLCNEAGSDCMGVFFIIKELVDGKLVKVEMGE